VPQNGANKKFVKTMKGTNDQERKLIQALNKIIKLQK
jgi:hypothetical protein